MTEHDDRNHSPPDAKGESDESDEIASFIIAPLRASEWVDADFSARVMSAVHADARAARHPIAAAGGWWGRPRTIRISPLAGLAMAAGVAGLIVLGGNFVAARRTAAAPMEASELPMATGFPSDTVHVVRFVLVDGSALAVSLIGDFNDWAKDATPLIESGGDGTWTVSLQVPRGRHEYAFLVRRPSGVEWVADPFATPVRDEFGTASSVVTVGGAGAIVMPTSS